MKSAVEWLLKILEGQKDKPFDYEEWLIAFNHAKEMEKQQIVDAYKADLYPCSDEDAEQYYNETFKK